MGLIAALMNATRVLPLPRFTCALWRVVSSRVRLLGPSSSALSLAGRRAETNSLAVSPGWSVWPRTLQTASVNCKSKIAMGVLPATSPSASSECA